jgi:hypothetical protein
MRKKISQSQLIATKAGKGSTIVMSHKEVCINKIREFITKQLHRVTTRHHKNNNKAQEIALTTVKTQ